MERKENDGFFFVKWPPGCSAAIVTMFVCGAFCTALAYGLGFWSVGVLLFGLAIVNWVSKSESAPILERTVDKLKKLSSSREPRLPMKGNGTDDDDS